jgi:adenylate/nucleoside-diphosphate kinase
MVINCYGFTPQSNLLTFFQLIFTLLLAAYNPKSSEYVRKKYKRKLMQFEETCELIKYLGDNMTKKYKEPPQRPIDFDFKLDKFMALKDMEPSVANWVL